MGRYIGPQEFDRMILQRIGQVSTVRVLAALCGYLRSLFHFRADSAQAMLRAQHNGVPDLPETFSKQEGDDD